MTTEIKPLNLGEASEEDLALAASIMKSGDDNILIRYLRTWPTVGVALKQADVDAPVTRRRVICSGTPYAAMVAFLHDGKLYIGWSRRHSGKALSTELLKALFEDTIKMMKDPRMVEKVAEKKAEANYEALLAVFAKSVQEFLTSGSIFDEIENVPFAKKVGKLTAIYRALKDTVIIEGKNVISGASGPMPTEIAKNLPAFIEYAEKKFAAKAANVASSSTKELACTCGTAIVAYK